MKNILVIATLCLLTICVKAQMDSTGHFHVPKMVIMPDGSLVRMNFDSIKKVFGGRDISFSFRDDGTYVHPAENKAEETAAEKKLYAHLNQPAPQLAYNDITGKRYSLASLKGKVVVLNFWFTQCGGCILEMPALNELKQNYNGKDVVFLAVTYDDVATINAFLLKKKFDYTIIPNARKACDAYDLNGYPVSMVIDRKGIVTFINDSIDSNIKSDLAKAIEDVKKQ